MGFSLGNEGKVSLPPLAAESALASALPLSVCSIPVYVANATPTEVTVQDSSSESETVSRLAGGTMMACEVGCSPSV